MSAKSTWKELLREQNALGWIVVLAVVLGIGAAVVIWGGGSAPKGHPAVAARPAPPK